VFRHADAGYEKARQVATARGVDIPEPGTAAGVNLPPYQGDKQGK